MRRVRPAINPGVADRAEFERLAAEWKQDTWYLSSPTAIAMHPAYQQIISMGDLAVPLILEDLERDPAQWFWALRAITGQSPVRESDYGNVEAMRDAWLAWGQQQMMIHRAP